MPTLKPKMTLVFSDANTERVLKAAIADRAEVHRTGASYEIEQILIDALIPPGKTEWYLTRLYSGDLDVPGAISAAFGDNAAGIFEMAESDALRPLVELASRQSVRATVDQSREEAFHAASCWSSVVDHLAEHADAVRLGSAEATGERRASAEAAAASLGIDVAEGRRIGGLLGPGDGRSEAKPYFDLVLRNWELLGSYNYTYRALMDVVSMASPWPSGARAREDLRAALAESFPPGGGE